jgi:hypothetical protein
MGIFKGRNCIIGKENPQTIFSSAGDVAGKYLEKPVRKSVNPRHFNLVYLTEK